MNFKRKIGTQYSHYICEDKMMLIKVLYGFNDVGSFEETTDEQGIRVDVCNLGILDNSSMGMTLHRT